MDTNQKDKSKDISMPEDPVQNPVVEHIINKRVRQGTVNS
jgi:hypothetical protein